MDYKDEYFCEMKRADKAEDALAVSRAEARGITALYDASIMIKETLRQRVAELETQLRTLEAQAAYYGCPHCGKPITLVAPPIDPPAPA